MVVHVMATPICRYHVSWIRWFYVKFELNDIESCMKLCIFNFNRHDSCILKILISIQTHKLEEFERIKVKVDQLAFVWHIWWSFLTKIEVALVEKRSLVFHLWICCKRKVNKPNLLLSLLNCDKLWFLPLLKRSYSYWIWFDNEILCMIILDCNMPCWFLYIWIKWGLV